MISLLGKIAERLTARFSLLNRKDSPSNKVAVTDSSNPQIHYGSGDNVAGDKIVQTRILYSDEQRIITGLPRMAGGNPSLNLNNAAILTQIDNYSDTEIVLALDNAPVTVLDHAEREYIQIADIQIQTPTPTTHQYLFRRPGQIRHTVTIGERTFAVTLMSIRHLNRPDSPNAREYTFGISES